MSLDPELDSLLAFWFSEPARARWFDATEAFDVEIRRRFLTLYEQARNELIGHWQASPDGCVGLVLLFDQIPRNLFRGTPEAYATDPAARAVTYHALEHGFDQALEEEPRLFLYLPLEHSESLEDQERSVRLMEANASDPSWAEYARKHRDVIARFGRFPHRNEILGRTHSAEEREFLENEGIGW